MHLSGLWLLSCESTPPRQWKTVYQRSFLELLYNRINANYADPSTVHRTVKLSMKQELVFKGFMKQPTYLSRNWSLSIQGGDTPIRAVVRAATGLISES